jgi:hypothetical protein
MTFKKIESRQRYRVFTTMSAVLILSALVLLAQGGLCPPAISSLMPTSASGVKCQYNSAGSIGMGFAAGDLPFQNSCANEVTKFPGHISFVIKHYGGDSAKIFKMQIDSEEQQRVADKKAEFENMQKQVKVPASKLVSMNPLKSESVMGGSLLYFDYYTDCTEGIKRSKPSVHLLAVAHNDSTAISIEIEGNMSAEAAKSAASEVLANFAKTDFNKLDK